MTCHAAIVSRELGIPCVVGTGEATRKLRDGEIVTVDATHGVVLEGASRTRARTGALRRRAGRGAPGWVHPRAAAVTATQILVNLSEPSQVQRVKDLPVDGVGLLRAEMMVLEALGGRSSPHAARGGPRRGVRRAHGRGPEHVRRRVRAAAGHLPHDRLPHQRVRRAARRRAVRAPGGQPDDRLPRRAALHPRARRLRARAGGAAPGVGRRPAQPARDAPVRAHHPRAAPLPRADRRSRGCSTGRASSCG